jgi:hypothetical protein
MLTKKADTCTRLVCETKSKTKIPLDQYTMLHLTIVESTKTPEEERELEESLTVNETLEPWQTVDIGNQWILEFSDIPCVEVDKWLW